MKIVIADDLPQSAGRLLAAVQGWTVDARAGRARPELEAALAGADALLVRGATRVDAALLAAAPHLRVIARAGTGVDNIDVEAATARGIVVMNAPGANSVSVAEHACALMLALARSIPAADALMKQGRWEKKHLVGAELRGKVLGVVGLGRVGREVSVRAHALGMSVVAYDPFISAQIALDHDVELVSLDDLCARADYISLHAPATPETARLFDAARIASCRRGVRLINTARGDLVDEDALAAAIESGHVAGAGLDVFAVEPPRQWRLAGMPQVVATPHIAASTQEAQEMVGIETAASVRDFLRDGVIRNAINLPSVSPEEFRRLQPFVTLSERLGSLAAQVCDGRTQAIGVRYYGELASTSNELLVTSVLAGLFRAMLATPVTPVNARSVAADRGVEIVESRSSRARNFTSLISVKLHTSAGERWVEGAVFEPGRPRLVLVDGVEVEAPLEGTLIVIRNDDQPGVIGEVGTILGRHVINIASFALGRSDTGAVGVVSVDERPSERPTALTDAAIAEIRAVPAIRDVKVVRL